MKIKNGTKGFTLIELLVVIAIIGALSSVVLASLNSARGKAKDAAIKEAMTQYANMMYLNYDDFGSYCNLNPGAWITASGVTCNTMSVSGPYAAKARQICQNMWDNAGENNFGAPGGYKLLLYVEGPGCGSAFALEAYLNNGQWYCVGSSGAKTMSANYWNSPGCYQNP